MYMAFDTPCPRARRTSFSPACSSASSCSSWSPLDVLLLFALAPFLVGLVPLAIRALCFFAFLSIVSSAVCFVARAVACVACKCRAEAARSSCCPVRASATSSTSGCSKESEKVRDVSSSPQCSVTDEEVRVAVAAPGVRSADLKVHVEDGTLVVTGRITKGAETYGVHRRVVVPRVADLETAVASHADGELVVTMQRKLKRIPVVPRFPAPVAAAADAEATAPAEKAEQPEAPAPAYSHTSEDEWVGVACETTEIVG